ncbi:MAG: glycogen/starch synthase [Candidatus Eisenbacteria bacterium]
MTPLSIVHVTTEFAPLVRVGGRADMVGGLAREQARSGHRVLVALPHYPFVELPAGACRRALAEIEVPWGMGRERATFELVELADGGPRLLLVGHAGVRAFYGRAGVYDDPETGAAYGDNAERFVFFARAALEGLKQMGERFDVLHAHDHQAAWAPCFARTHEALEPAFARMATIFTVHNLGYQGLYDAWVLALAGFAPDQFFPGAVFEFWGRVNFMKVGLAFADLVTTVSRRHAREIQTDGEFGYGLEGLLARRSSDLRGVLNGIDDTWDPASDPWIAQRYDAVSLGLRAHNRAALAAECGLGVGPDSPLVGMAAGLEEQKGWELILQAQEELARLDARFVFMGKGQARYRDMLAGLSAAHPGRIHFREGRDAAFTHRLLAGCDLLLSPSRFEPCGIYQMAAQRYGAVPVVHAVGGLADSVDNFDPLTGTGTGFRFERFDAAELTATLRRAVAVWRQPELWKRLQASAMGSDFSWSGPATRYDALYVEVLGRIAAAGAPTLETVRARFELPGR